jgi:hypothetical protein
MTTTNIKTQRKMKLSEFLLNGLYSNLGLTPEKMAILGITPGQPFPFSDEISEELFTVEDQDKSGRYALIHYSSGAVKLIDSSKKITRAQKEILQIIKDFRGLVIDLQAKPGFERVCPSFGYTPICTRVTLSLKDDKLSLYDSTANQYSLDWNKNKVTIGQAFEGALLRFWRRGGVTRMSTHHKIDGTNSRFGDVSVPTFSELFSNMGGDIKSLYNEEYEDSPYVYYFILCTPSLMMASHMDVGKGHVIFIECVDTVGIPSDLDSEARETFQKEYPSFETSPYFDDSVSKGNVDLKTLESVTEDGLVVPCPPANNDPNNKIIYQATSLGGTWDQVLAVANTILTTGYTGANSQTLDAEGNIIGDRHHLPGESLILSYYDDAGNRHMLKISPPCYNWRCAVRGNTPNLKLRAYQLCNLSIFSEKESKDQIEARKKYNKVSKTSEYFVGSDEYAYTFAQLFGNLSIPSDTDFRRMAEISNTDPSWFVLPPTSYTYTDGVEYKLEPFDSIKVDSWPAYNPKNKIVQWDPRTNRRRIIFLALAVSVPLHQREEVFGLFTKYEQATNDIINFIITATSNRKNINDFFEAIKTDAKTKLFFFDKQGTPKTSTKRLIDIWRQASKYANDIRAKTDKTHQLVFTDNVVSLVRREHADSRYAMARDISRYENRDLTPAAETVEIAEVEE